MPHRLPENYLANNGDVINGIITESTEFLDVYASVEAVQADPTQPLRFNTGTKYGIDPEYPLLLIRNLAIATACLREPESPPEQPLPEPVSYSPAVWRIASRVNAVGQLVEINTTQLFTPPATAGSSSASQTPPFATKVTINRQIEETYEKFSITQVDGEVGVVRLTTSEVAEEKLYEAAYRAFPDHSTEVLDLISGELDEIHVDLVVDRLRSLYQIPDPASTSYLEQLLARLTQQARKMSAELRTAGPQDPPERSQLQAIYAAIQDLRRT